MSDSVTVEIPVPASPIPSAEDGNSTAGCACPPDGGGSTESTMALDPLVEKTVDQTFAMSMGTVRDMMNQAGARFNTAMGSTDVEAARTFLMSSQLVGAAAAARLDKNALASDILQQNSARDQPGQNKA